VGGCGRCGTGGSGGGFHPLSGARGAGHELRPLAARATLTRLAEEHQTLDLLAAREALRELPDSGYRYQYTEGYDPYSDRYVCERWVYVGGDRYADTLSVDLKDGTAYVESSWGSQTYWDRWVHPARGEPHYAGAVDDDFRRPPSWAVEKSPQAEATWEIER